MNQQEVSQPQIEATAQIHSTAVIEGNIKIGKNVMVGAGVVIGARSNETIVIEQGVILKPGCMIQGNCRIGTNSYIGLGSVIFHAEVGEGTVVKQLAVLEKVNIPPRRLVESLRLVHSPGETLILPPIDVATQALIDQERKSSPNGG